MRTDRIVQSPGRGKPRLRGLAVREDSDQPDDEQCLASDSAGTGVVVLLASSHGNGDWFPVFPGIGQPPVPIARMLRRDRKEQTIAEEARKPRSRFRRAAGPRGVARLLESDRVREARPFGRPRGCGIDAVGRWWLATIQV